MRTRPTRRLVVVDLCSLSMLLFFSLCNAFFGGEGGYTKSLTEREFCSNIAFYNMTKEGTSLVRLSEDRHRLHHGTQCRLFTRELKTSAKLQI